MKNIIILLLLVIAINVKSQNLSSEDKIRAEITQAVEQLQLDKSQASKYEKIIRKYEKLVSEIQSIPADSAQKRVNKRNELIGNRSSEIKAILTPEQYAKYKKWTGEDRFRVSREELKRRADSLKIHQYF